MASYDAATAQCSVYTFKDGLLARAAHDLELKVNRFQIEVDDDKRSVTATFDATSLEVARSISDGGLEENLKRSDQQKIEQHIDKDVLNTRRHPEIRFESTEVTPEGEGFVVAGNLTINGVSRPIVANVAANGDRWETSVTVHQPDFGITPFKALMGAIKIKPDVRVELSVPRRQ